MDFNRHGVPGCSINDTYEHFIDTWRDVTLTDSSFTSILTLKGTVTLNGNDYYAVADLDPVTGEVMLLDLNFPEHRNDEWDTIEGIELQTCSARLLAARLFQPAMRGVAEGAHGILRFRRRSPHHLLVQSLTTP